MKRYSNLLLASLMVITVALCGVILWILLFKQTAIPEFAINGKDGKDATVDYSKIEDYVRGYVDTLPKPKDGRSATDEQIARAVALYLIAHPPAKGEKGDTVIGASGSSCSTQQTETGALIVCEDGTSAIINNGTNGVDGRTPKIQCNTQKNRWEVGYVGDDSWLILRDKNDKPIKCMSTLNMPEASL